ncbi:putative transporter [Wickerhamomyces ciferrii]|uniref:Transporter n=1 Tax=Wickerhamomyces ciferrii (strain ATCC 14091 / BCRC 22168 / CBS 111 / JCM 3599 / NBRC 0793 / NRRL Y-1031 F-60-10) TaxID=1206466 RepID=K0KKP2_WICCF|nr:putative transporter [Wickerhamomyces ciferrii]CCH42722.1 putative transporter [Wickerhamomyces ciferrii]
MSDSRAGLLSSSNGKSGYIPINNDLELNQSKPLPDLPNSNGLEGGLQGHQHHVEKSSKKLIAVIALFLISLFSFVSQTELTSYLYNGLNFNQPYLLLYLTHSSWIMIWPIQVISIAIFKHFKKSKRHGYNIWDLIKFKKNIGHSLKHQHRNIFKTSGILINQDIKYDHEYPNSIISFLSTPSIKHIFQRVFFLTIILSIAGCTWYVAMGLAPASDITAIYNCSAFSALIFAIPILQEKFTYIKISSVLLAIIGVFFVAYGGENDSSDKSFPYRVIGDIIISIGAVLYGLYEVIYKKQCCPPNNVVSSRRQAAFSNFCASLIGFCTFITLWIVVLGAHLTGISKFYLITSGFEWLIIILSLLSNMIYSLSFLALMSLTSPVLSSVSSLITILIVGLFEWILFGVKLSLGQIIGDLFVVIGFGVLSYSYWAEITEEDVDEDDDFDATDNEN